MEQPTQFKVVKKAVMEALKAGAYQHEARSSIDVKNLLATGEVSAAEVMTLLGKSRGTEHQCSLHHFDSSMHRACDQDRRLVPEVLLHRA